MFCGTEEDYKEKSIPPKSKVAEKLLEIVSAIIEGHE